MSSQTARKLSLGDLPDATRVLSDAFFPDPLWVYLYKDEKKRAKYLYLIFKHVLRFCIVNDLAYGVNQPVEAVAIWVIPQDSGKKVKISGVHILSMVRLLFSNFSIAMLRAIPVFWDLYSKQKKQMSGRYYKLEILGVRPESQGKGYSTTLVKPFIAEAKNRGMSIYLETMASKNVTLYEHLGFSNIEHFSAPEKGLAVWTFKLSS